MNKIIKNVLIKIEKAGFEAYVVGGYVRDKLLRRTTYDIDITTNALPKDVALLFEGIAENSYGGCSFKISKYNFDITTFRKEYKYINRKPTKVMYINSLEEDILRRDFTVNTLCMDKNGKIIDLCSGKDDLKNQIIRAVGNAEEKFIEDPLRILRAVRFASTLNFIIEDNLKIAIKNSRFLVKTLSKERIKAELSKILLSKNYVYGFSLMKELGILEVLEISYDKIIFSSDLLVMFSEIDLSSDYFTKNENNQIKSIKKLINYGKIDDAALYSYGLYLCTVVGEVFGTGKKEINKLYKNMWINENKPLKISTNDIMGFLGISEGREVGLIKSEVCELILKKKLSNDEKKIKEYLINRK